MNDKELIEMAYSLVAERAKSGQQFPGGDAAQVKRVFNELKAEFGTSGVNEVAEFAEKTLLQE